MANKNHKENFEKIYNSFKDKKPYYRLLRKKTKSKKIKELLEDIERVNKDFRLFVKQSEKQMVELKKYAKADTIKELLPILDDFEEALKYKDNDLKQFKDGTKLIKEKLSKILK